MQQKRRAHAEKPASYRSAARRAFGPMVEAGAAAYVRRRDLPRLIALWPRELADESLAGRRELLQKLRRALRAERRRGLAAHWSYDLNRHLALLSAYKGELYALAEIERKTQPACARAKEDARERCCGWKRSGSTRGKALAKGSATS
jgi:hypothetical protein